ncbi:MULTISPECIES: bifunctional 3-phenylpropionate/cinnamic acid dioxygenase ferredoxin subunit [Rhodococcus]|uniref:Bifunctional 3-phenylpropionate/cinnamic acid dioxygenase ferredoxin subunit n=1 Tax=Rhodococcus aetherivorans TaxID=191292 RepID=A0AA46SC31_9NOCA|nr:MULTISPECIES: bifunctional 3-phenylpropionate/cinnamic acid dioxygenase ferredoxin subunit [Rhodococcus]AKE92465.1 (2Fe-2S)-binding protein [Rhodococcus aetherivorans]PND52236.1 bifunctional 3-phenylpropionate/cinnamic acid dioxygenase ferredoxin subunit [Rhodococcus sp. ENV425]USC17267.1 bifunctional 3-phenylpropionate/cinnamic acid dioxygenase ferredoxin subunit [Rhodococcus sp. 11-3]UYF92657.1 bifunctional 3-phenylpropionate/cinnamic acid dioxygenase ferredoxin subunit [Rhodococcus aether
MTAESSSENTRWVRVCAVGDLDDDDAVRLDSRPPVSVFRSNGEYFCVDDTCTHETYSLADGWIENCVVECPLHMAKFCLRTGRPLNPPATTAVGTHPVRIEGGDIHVGLPDSYELKEGARSGTA